MTRTSPVPLTLMSAALAVASSLFIVADAWASQARALGPALEATKGGKVSMPPAPALFASRFGMLNDRFGVSRMILVAP